MTSDRDGRWAWAEIDVSAIRHNIGALRELVHPSGVWAVVKANGYGHGAVTVARAAIDAGVDGLCVALVQEGEELRREGVDVPILVLSQQPTAQHDRLVAASLTPTIDTRGGIDALDRAVERTPSAQRPYPAHLKIDTGMQRVGAAPAAAIDLARSIASSDRLQLAGVFTHLACADDPTSSATDHQLASFDGVVHDLHAAGFDPPVVHAANSAAALRVAAARRSFVRVGIAVYGISPAPPLDDLTADLRPAMRLVARVSHVKRVAADTHVSYGWRHRFEYPTSLATVPIGYADGVPRRLGTLPDGPGADVVIRGRRCPIVGVVTMDQLMVDVGGADGRLADVEVGDEVVLIGEAGGHRIRAEDWAERLGTIGYEIVCGISHRVPRVPRRSIDG